ncbi:MAG: hypothetical protein R3F11_05020 [Verrucomicrobiales bacterium]
MNAPPNPSIVAVAACMNPDPTAAPDDPARRLQPIGVVRSPSPKFGAPEAAGNRAASARIHRAAPAV